MRLRFGNLLTNDPYPKPKKSLRVAVLVQLAHDGLHVAQDDIGHASAQLGRLHVLSRKVCGTTAEGFKRLG